MYCASEELDSPFNESTTRRRDLVASRELFLSPYDRIEIDPKFLVESFPQERYSKGQAACNAHTISHAWLSIGSLTICVPHGMALYRFWYPPCSFQPIRRRAFDRVFVIKRFSSQHYIFPSPECGHDKRILSLVILGRPIKPLRPGLSCTGISSSPWRSKRVNAWVLESLLI